MCSSDLAVKFTHRAPLDQELEVLEQVCRHPSPNIVAVYAAVLDDTGAVSGILMERMYGSVASRLQDASLPKVSKEQRLLWCRQAATGLLHLHDVCDVVHRDLHTGNLLLTTNNYIKIADFGLSKAQGDALLTLTTFNALFSPPEALQDAAPVHSKASDVFMLALSMCQILSNDAKFLGTPKLQAMFQGIKAEPPSNGALYTHVTKSG